MKNLKQIIRKKLKESSDRKVEYGCVMLYFKFDEMINIHKVIDPNDVYDEVGYGLEDEPHVTLLYGLHDEVTLDDVKEVLSRVNFGSVKMTNASLFSNPDYDVLKYEAEGDGLREANKMLSRYPHTTNFPDYSPHMTIGYLNPETGQKYADIINKSKYATITLNPIYAVYTQPNGNKTKIEL